MTFFGKIRDLWLKHAKLFKIVIALVLSLSFAASIAFAVFNGDEFSEDTAATQEAKGVMRFGKAEYATSYFEGDNFRFDVTETEVIIRYKDPETKEIVSDDDLMPTEYGFMVNGQGEIVNIAEFITIDKTVESIAVVYKKYPNLRINIPVTVLDAFDSDKLTSSLVYEAEDAELYEGTVLLTEEEKAVKPSTDKPYRSDKGTNVDGKDCSGGACLRNFQAKDMRVIMRIISMEDVEAELEIMVCKRTSSSTFGKYYLFTINGQEYEEINNQLVPTGSGYFSPYTLQKVKVKLKRGINVFEFHSGSALGRKNPANLDGIKLTTDDAVIAIYTEPAIAAEEVVL